MSGPEIGEVLFPRVLFQQLRGRDRGYFFRTALGRSELFCAWFFMRACALYGKEAVEVWTQSAPLTDWTLW